MRLTDPNRASQEACLVSGASKDEHPTSSCAPMTAYEQPIPMHRRAPTAGNDRDIPIQFHDPRYGEALVDARACGVAGDNYYARTDGRNVPYDEAVPGAVRELWCRQSIVAMLVGVNERLADYGAEVYVWDAYRPVACQARTRLHQLQLRVLALRLRQPDVHHEAEVSRPGS